MDDIKKLNILIIDDSVVDRTVLRKLLIDEYNIIEVSSGIKALSLLKLIEPLPSLILLDYIMPDMDGFEFLRNLRKNDIYKNIPVILVSAENSQENENIALELGVADFIHKNPFSPNLVKHRITNVVEFYRHKNDLKNMVEEHSKKLRRINEMMVEAFSSVIEYRSLESGKHIRRMCNYTKEMLKSIYENSGLKTGMNLEIIEDISNAAALHDIGKIAIPDAILLKPGPLTKDEFEIMKTHTTQGCNIISTLGDMENKQYFRYCYDICRHHHERIDGKGYPDGLKDNDVTLSIQAVGIADVYDALRSSRVYKPAYSHEKTVKMILGGECGIFSEEIFLCFSHISHKFEEIANKYNDE